MKKQQIEQTIKYIKEKMQNDSSGHDVLHVMNVYNNAREIASKEVEERLVNIFVVEMAALLHDLYDHKLGYSKDEQEEYLSLYLDSINVCENEKEHVIHIITNMSFNKGLNKFVFSDVEGMIVQDADRLDAIGAIGIARTFAYGGSKSRAIYDDTKENSIQHFYDKLLLLKDKMNTKYGREMAEQRHLILEQFLEQFFKECKI